MEHFILILMKSVGIHESVEMCLEFTYMFKTKEVETDTQEVCRGNKLA